MGLLVIFFCAPQRNNFKQLLFCGDMNPFHGLDRMRDGKVN